MVAIAESGRDGKIRPYGSTSSDLLAIWQPELEASKLRPSSLSLSSYAPTPTYFLPGIGAALIAKPSLWFGLAASLALPPSAVNE